MINKCNPKKECNVCAMCCKEYISDGPACDECVKTNCLSIQDINKSQSILVIIIIVQVIILIVLAIRKKKRENNYIKLPTDKLSTDTFTQKQKFMNITWIVIGIGIIVSIFLFYLFKKDKPSSPPVASHVPTFSLTVSNTSIKDANGEYTMIGNQLYQGKKFLNPDGEEVYFNHNPVHWGIQKYDIPKPTITSPVSYKMEIENTVIHPKCNRQMIFGGSRQNCVSVLQTYSNPSHHGMNSPNPFTGGNILYTFNYQSYDKKIHIYIYTFLNATPRPSSKYEANFTIMDPNTDLWPGWQKDEYFIDITSDNKSIYLLTLHHLYHIKIDAQKGMNGTPQRWSEPWDWISISSSKLKSKLQPLFVISALDNIYIIYKNTDTITIYTKDNKSVESIIIKGKIITCLPMFNMLIFFTTTTIYYFNIAPTKSPVPTKASIQIPIPELIGSLTLYDRFTVMNNYIIINKYYQNKFVLFDTISQTVLPLKNPIGYGDLIIYKTKTPNQSENILLTINYDETQISIYTVNFPNNEKIGGWIIAPLTFNKNIYTDITRSILYLVSNNDNLKCGDNTSIWGIYNSHIENLEKLISNVQIIGSGCTHSFIPQPTEHQSTKQPFIKYKTEKIIFSIILSVELLILLIVGSRKYLKLAITQNFFDMQFIAVLTLCIGISIASYNYLNTLTAEHVLRIIIGSQICILSLLLFRKYNISSKL